LIETPHGWLALSREAEKGTGIGVVGSNRQDAIDRFAEEIEARKRARELEERPS
jgi:hypothetical protein